MQEIQVIPVNREKAETPRKRRPTDYRDKVIVGEALVIAALSVLVYILQAGPI